MRDIIVSVPEGVRDVMIYVTGRDESLSARALVHGKWIDVRVAAAKVRRKKEKAA